MLKIISRSLLYHFAMLLCCLIGFFYRSYFYSVLLMDLVHREETLYNVIRSVTRNGRSIILTGMPHKRPPLTERSFEVIGPKLIIRRAHIQAKIAMFASILIYLFAIIIFLFFQEQCIKEIEDLSNDGEPIVENHCETLILAIITTFNEGLRNGGGIGDYLIPLSQHHDQVNHGFKDPLFVLDVHMYKFLIIFEREISLARFTFLSAITLDESYYPSRFSSDSSQKGKSTSTENSHSNSSKRFVTFLHTRETNFTTRENIHFYDFFYLFIFSFSTE